MMNPMREMLRRHPYMITHLFRIYMILVLTYVAVGLTLGWFS